MKAIKRISVNDIAIQREEMFPRKEQKPYAASGAQGFSRDIFPCLLCPVPRNQLCQLDCLQVRQEQDKKDGVSVRPDTPIRRPTRRK